MTLPLSQYPQQVQSAMSSENFPAREAPTMVRLSPITHVPRRQSNGQKSEGLKAPIPFLEIF